jgi:hypothetical protein
MERFTWRPAALRAKRTVTVSAEGLVLEDGATLRWADVDAVSFALDRTRRVTMMTLRLCAGSDEVLLSVTGDGPEVARYVEMLRALTGALAAARPDLTITIGHEGGARWGMFLVGAAGVLVGLGLVGIGIALGVGGDWGEGAGMGFVGLVAALSCSAIALSNLPRGARPESPLSEFHAGLSLPDS